MKNKIFFIIALAFIFPKTYATETHFDANTQNNNTVITDTEWYAYGVGYTTKDVNLFSKIKYSLKDNNLYIKAEYATDGSNNLDLTEYLYTVLANDGLYQASTTNESNFGYKLTSFSKITPISKKSIMWTYTPFSNKASQELIRTDKYEEIDLSEKSISEFVHPFNHFTGLDSTLTETVGAYPAYYVKKLHGKTFPAGATCLKSTTSSNNVAFANIDMNNPSANFNLKKSFPFGYTQKTLNNYPLYLSKKIQSNMPIEAVVKIGTHYYYAEYYNSGIYNSYVSKTKQYEQDYKQAITLFGKDSINAKMQGILLKALKSECNLFNKVASQAIDAAK